jgi:hypothetical protein
VSNGGPAATENLAITLGVQYNPDGGFVPVPISTQQTTVSVSDKPILANGDSYCYPYHVDIPDAYVKANAAYKLTAYVTITNHNGKNFGTPYGPSPSTPEGTTLGTPQLLYDQVTVQDQYPMPDGQITTLGTTPANLALNTPYTWTYERTQDATSVGLNQKFDNTATIVDTGQTANAEVILNVYDLNVAKDAQTSFTRTYQWGISKTSGQTSPVTLQKGESLDVKYTVTVSGKGYVDSDWGAASTITVTNNAPIAATINSLSDVVSPDLTATVTLDNPLITFPYQLDPGASITAHYVVSLPDATSRTNTATASLENHNYKWDKSVTDLGTHTDFTGTAAVDFTGATIKQLDTSVTVSDTYAGTLGTVSITDTLPKTFTYTRTVGPYDTPCKTYPVDNTASFVASDTGATDSSSVHIDVNVPCAGCTLTAGYWYTHGPVAPNGGPQKHYNNAWDAWKDQKFFLLGTNTGATYWTVMQQQGGQNPYYILSYQCIAAILNQQKGASTTPAVDSAMSAAQQLFNKWTPDTLATMKNSKDKTTHAQYIGLLNQFTTLANTLNSYNTGQIGPGHCTEPQV